MSIDALAQLEPVTVGVPFLHKGERYHVLDNHGGVYWERMPRYQTDFRTQRTNVTKEEFARQFGRVAISRDRVPGDGLGPLLQGDRVLKVPFVYGAVPPGKDPRKNPGVPERTIPSDVMILGRYDMRYELGSNPPHRCDKDGTRPFMLETMKGIAHSTLPTEKFTEMGFEVDFELLGDPIPWADPKAPGVIYLAEITPKKKAIEEVKRSVADWEADELRILVARRLRKEAANASS